MVKTLALALAVSALAASAGAAVPATAPSAAAPTKVPPKAGHAQSLSPSPQSQDLPLLPAAPKIPPLANPPAWETFTVVTLLSAPFTALWCGLAAGLVEVAAQHGRIPPKFGTPEYAAVGAAAGAASLGIAVVSLDWGSGRPADPAKRTHPRAEVAPRAPAPKSAAPAQGGGGV